MYIYGRTGIQGTVALGYPRSKLQTVKFSQLQKITNWDHQVTKHQQSKHSNIEQFALARQPSFKGSNI